MLSINILKLLVVVVVLFLPLVATLLPVKLVRLAETAHRDSLNRLVSWLNCLSGGVFLGACLLDLLPDVEEMFDRIVATTPGITSFPLAQFSVALGFFVVLTVEGLVVAFRGHAGHSHDVAEVSDHECCGPEHDRSEDVGIVRSRSFSVSSAPGALAPTISYGSINRAPLLTASSPSNGASTGPVVSRAGLRSALLVVALSLHSVIEGLAIGLQQSRQLLLQLFVAVALHKTVLGFSLGVSLARDGAPTFGAMLVSALAFCLASPIGMAVGWAMVELEESEDGGGSGVPAAGGPLNTVNAVLQGAACGTFLYVTFFEVLPHEFSGARDRLLRVLAVVLGFAVVCGVLFLDPDVQATRCIAP